MSNQYSNYHGKSIAAKDVASYSDYLDRYEDLGSAANNWMNDDSNIHFANYVRDNDEVWEKWKKSGKTDKKDMWDFGHRDWNTEGGKMKDRHLAKVLTNPGDLNKTGSGFDDMGVVSAFKSARWGYDQDAQDKLRAGYGKFNWGTYGYNEGREMKWLDAKDKSNIYATTKGVASGNKTAKDIYGLTPQQPKESEPKVIDKPTSTSTSTNTSNPVFNTPSYSNTTGTTGTNQNSGNNGGTYYDSYQWVNNNSGDIWKPDPDQKWGDPQPGKQHSPSDGPYIDWADDPRLQEWTKTPVKSGQSYSPKKPGWNEPPREPRPTSSGYGVNPIGSSADDPLTGDTYIGRGWANYWQQSIPDKDPNWSERFSNQYVKFGDQNQVVNRQNLVKRIQARTQHHMDQSDYLGYLSRGQMRGENRPDWKQPGPIKSDYQPDIDIDPFLEGIYNIGKDN